MDRYAGSALVSDGSPEATENLRTLLANCPRSDKDESREVLVTSWPGGFKVRKVLDDDRIDGAVAAEIRLRPARAAWSVSDYEQACSLIELLCQLCGGAADILVPAPDPGTVYEQLLAASTIDVTVGDTASTLAPGLADNPYRRLPALLTYPENDKAAQRPVQQVVLDIDDAWHLTYITALGSLGEHFNATVKAELMLRKDLTLEEFITLKRVEPNMPGVADLLARLENSDVAPPVAVSMSMFPSRPAGAQQNALDGWLQDRAAFSRQLGGAIVVLYTPGNVADLCLTWNLRARHGWARGLPLALPFTTEGSSRRELIDGLVQLVLRTGMRIGGWPVQLVSESIDTEHLLVLAQEMKTAGQVADVVEVDDVLLPARPPARTSRTPLVFAAGQARAAVRTDRDRSELSVLSAFRVLPRLHATVALDGDEVPSSAVLRRRDWSSPRFTDGGASVTADSDELKLIQWPTGWERLAAVCADHGVNASPSASGRTALALLRQLGSLDDVRWLAHRPLINLLYDKASSSGMSWWKKRANEIAHAAAVNADDSDAAMYAIADAIAQVSISHGGESAATITFGELCTVLGKSAAQSWLAWAEDRRLLLRGIVLKCPECQHEQWRLVADLAPPLTCPGCLRHNERPYKETSLSFSYRLGEGLRRAIENDSIYHLLVARHLVVVMEGSPVPQVGIHPGVDLTRDGEQAEADVLILLASGEVVPVEVKIRSVSFKQHDLDMLDRVVGWFGSRASILAAGDSDDDMAEYFIAAAVENTVPVRRLITCQDWLRQYPFVSMGSGYPGPKLDGANHRDVERDAIAIADPAVVDESQRPTAAEIDAQFADEIVRLRPDRPLSPRIREKIDKYSGSG